MIEGVERACSPRCPSTVSAAPCSPVLVVRAGEHEYVLIDGYARVESLVALGRDVVEATVLDLTEPEALVFVHRLEATRPRSALEEGWLIAELVDRHGWSHRTIALRLQRSASWICRRLALVRTLPESVQCAVLAGTVSPQAAMKSLVPLARANNSDCECLVANLRETLSVRQAERLYQGWKRADPDGREHIVTMPWLFLQAFEATQVAAAIPWPSSSPHARTLVQVPRETWVGASTRRVGCPPMPWMPPRVETSTTPSMLQDWMFARRCWGSTEAPREISRTSVRASTRARLPRRGRSHR